MSIHRILLLVRLTNEQGGWNEESERDLLAFLDHHCRKIFVLHFLMFLEARAKKIIF